MTDTRFIAELRRQRTPGHAAFPEYDATVVSPELPCGASWLASCLLELGVPLCNPWGIDTRDQWKSLVGRRFRYECPGSGWSRLVPGLVHGREFVWRRSPVPCFTHSWPGWLPLTSRLVLFVRDPRDALRSDWLRKRRAGQIDPDMDLHQFIESPAEGLPVSRRDALVLFLIAWCRVLERSAAALIVRFEDYKSRPSATLDQALEFLDVASSRRARDAALRASDHARVVSAERRLLAAGLVPTALLGEGRAFAWQHAPENERITPDPAMARVCRWLGYPVGEASGRSVPIPLERVRAALSREDGADPDLLSIALEEAAEIVRDAQPRC
ncbi:MAG: sulfotransferase domain-containing protein [Wenzhouxiangellaceae bacterium]|nr:sulfotransferase domain-containing protein [Wenzhouxiangellaceae bacterium]